MTTLTILSSTLSAAPPWWSDLQVVRQGRSTRGGHQSQKYQESQDAPFQYQVKSEKNKWKIEKKKYGVACSISIFSSLKKRINILKPSLKVIFSLKIFLALCYIEISGKEICIYSYFSHLSLAWYDSRFSRF